MNTGACAEPLLATEPASEAVPLADQAWRTELSARLNKYRARRKAPPPRYPSLRLPFEVTTAATSVAEEPAPAFHAISHLALALDGSESFAASGVESVVEETVPVAPPPVKRVPATVIEFPRFAWAPPAPASDELAEPVGNLPRILEVPEVVPPAPALGGITIEPAKSPEPEKRQGIDIPWRAAPLGRRIAAAVLDWMIVVAASAVFGFVFWKVAQVRPPRLQWIALAAGLPCVLWSIYQYLMIVYSAATPGLRLAGLALSGFDGQATTRRQRRARVIASYLSALSLGLGYVWVFLDEDSLCWHDRITHTCLGPRQ